MGFLEQIEKVIASTEIPINKINLEDVKRHLTIGHFKNGYKIEIEYNSSNEIKEIALKESSFEYIIYMYNTSE